MFTLVRITKKKYLQILRNLFHCRIALILTSVILSSDVNVGSDFKDTPCAPNDFFQLPNCITCYCNSAKTGYLCSDSVCSDDHNSTESNIKNITQSSSINLEAMDVTKSSTEASLELKVSSNADVVETKNSTETLENDVVEESTSSREN